MKWQTVFKTENPQRAEIVKAILIEKGLQPIIINKKDSAYLFGLMEVQVSADEILKSIRIIENIKFE